MNRTLKVVLYTAGGIVLTGGVIFGVHLYQDVKTLKATTYGFGKVKFLRAYTRGGLPYVDIQTSITADNPERQKLKIRKVNLAVNYRLNTLATIILFENIEIATGKAYPLTIPLYVKPILSLLKDFFNTSQIPVRFYGTMQLYSSAIGTYITLPIDVTINLKDVLKEASPDYIKALFDVFK
jgi:hypothetical protein